MRFEELTEYFKRLEATTKRLEMFDILSEAFSKAEKTDIAKTVYLLQEELLPPFFNVQLGIADRIVEKAISDAYGVNLETVKSENKKVGDLGEVSEKYNKTNKKSTMSVTEVYDDIFKLSSISGEGSVEGKISALSLLLKKISPLESRYLIRFIMGKLRLGVGEATIMEALSKAKTGSRNFKSELERAFNLCSDLGHVAEVFYDKGDSGIKKFHVEVMRPIRPALAERLPDAEEIIKRLGKCAVDQKFDGFRAQVHKDGDDVKVFSRNLEDITHFMPEIVDAVKKLKHKKMIFDGEALTYDEDTNTLYPFQITIQRKRKHNIEEVSESFPLRLFVFDIMLLDEQDLMQDSYRKRRDIVDKTFEEESTISKSKFIITDSAAELTKFFEDTIGSGLEGVVAKKLDAPYSAGARNFNWIKIKRSYKSQLNDTIDIVILGYFRGKGMRADFGIGAVLGGVYNKSKDIFETITKVGSGFSENQFKELRKMLDDVKVPHKPARVESIMVPDVWVAPAYVITVKADEITRSPMHTCGMEKGVGYALRFPRAVSFIRTDKRVEDVNTSKEIIEMFKNQKRVELK
ncbi:MAG: ATP-dependent DNA ligase [Candidatus Parvarchaeota archaeon]|nr:ATP-dependent DNA ligase [Candidatus Parvarchaeota archaeon]MCL5101004.1 ATP-dependent DNA ligase [Candidatus Parvarchaeota archaeon]